MFKPQDVSKIGTVDPYDFLPPATDLDLPSGKPGRGRPSAFKNGITITNLRLPEDWGTLMDRIIQSGVVPVKTKGDMLRMLIHESLLGLIEKINDGKLGTVAWRMRRVQEQWASYRMAEDVSRSLAQLRSMARGSLIRGDNYGAVKNLREAKRIVEELSALGQEQANEFMLGAVAWGEKRPDTFQDDPLALLWDQVVEDDGERFYDDSEKAEGVVAETVKG